MLGMCESLSTYFHLTLKASVRLCDQYETFTAFRTFSLYMLVRGRIKLKAQLCSPLGWSLRVDLWVDPGIPGPPPAEHWYHEAWPHTQLLSSSHMDLHPGEQKILQTSLSSVTPNYFNTKSWTLSMKTSEIKQKVTAITVKILRF